MCWGYVWYMFGIVLGYAWDFLFVLGIFWGYAWDFFVLMFGIFLGCFVDMFGISW